MADQLESNLVKMKNGVVKRIRGHAVIRDGELYRVDDRSYTLAEAVSVLSEANKPHSFDYSKIAFLEKTPSGMLVRLHRIKDRPEHTNLLGEVRKNNNYLWYADVKLIDGKHYAMEPHVVDWDSVPDQVESKTSKPTKGHIGLRCPFCNHSVSSTPGRTLHVKHKHPELLADYYKLIDQKK